MRAGAHGRAGLRQHDVDADRPQQRALARHVRAGHHQEGAGGPTVHVVGDAPIFRDERVPQLPGHELRGLDDHRERPGGIVVDSDASAASASKRPPRRTSGGDGRGPRICHRSSSTSTWKSHSVQSHDRGCSIGTRWKSANCPIGRVLRSPLARRGTRTRGGPACSATRSGARSGVSATRRTGSACRSSATAREKTRLNVVAVALSEGGQQDRTTPAAGKATTPGRWRRRGMRRAGRLGSPGARRIGPRRPRRLMNHGPFRPL